MKSSFEVLEEIFSELDSRKGGTKVMRKVAIVSTPRSGSTHFCLSLADSGQFGWPLEWFGREFVQAYGKLKRVQSTTIQDYLNYIFSRTTSENGLFSVNFHVDNYLEWKQQGRDLFDLGFERVYYLYRRDKFAQALSLARARKTGLWSSYQWRNQDSTAAGSIQSEPADSDILTALRDIVQQQEYFDTNLKGKVDRSFAYEDFSATDACFQEVLNDCQIKLPEGTRLCSGLKRQSSADGDERIQKLLAALGQEAPHTAD